MPPACPDPFSFATAGRIRYGWGVAAELADEVAALGASSVMLVTGSDPERHRAPIEGLRAAGVRVEVFAVAGEPSVETVSQGVEAVRAAACGAVVAIGGGSVMDAGKAVAGLAANPGDPFEYLEVVGKGEPLRRAALACICLPTTAGSGAEVTRNAVLSSPEHRVKVSLRSAFLLPRLALVDPALTAGCPPAQTAASGLDALTQLIEAFVSNRANPVTDAFCREGIPRAARSVRRACAAPEDQAARGDMSLAALLSGLALANAKLGAVHGFAAVLGGRYPAPHGAVCARLLPEVFAANFAAVSSRVGEGDLPARFEEIARLLTGDPAAGAAGGVTFLRGLCDELRIPGLSEYGIGKEDFPEIVRRAQRASSMQGNPVPLTKEELAGILRKAE